MTVLEFLLLLIVAGLCGSVGRSLGGHAKGGFIVSIGVGFVGATLGVWMARELALPELFQVRIGDTEIPIAWSIIGSAIFVAVLTMIGRGRS